MAITNNNSQRSFSNSSFETSPDVVTSNQIAGLTPEIGAQIYDKDSKQLKAWDGTRWIPFMTRSATGWGLYGNTTITEIAPLTIPEDDTTLFPFNEVLLETNLPADVDTFLDPLNNKILPRYESDVFNFNLSFKAKSSKNAGSGDFIVQSDGIPFRTQRFLFSKGLNTEQGFNFISTQYVSEYLASNGFRIYIKAVNGNLEIYDAQVLVTRIYKSQ